MFQLLGLGFIFLDGIASFICQFKMENRKDTTLIYAKLELSNYLLNIELLRNLVVLQLIKHRGVQQQRQGTRVTSTGDTIRERTVAVLYVYFIQLFLEKCNYFIYILVSLSFLCLFYPIISCRVHLKCSLEYYSPSILNYYIVFSIYLDIMYI